LHDRSIRWFETRSRADLESTLAGLAYPIVVIDLGRDPVAGLEDLDLVSRLAPDARILVLDPQGHGDIPELARELGATHVVSSFVPPPAVADLIVRWVTSSRLALANAGWSRTSFPETQSEPWSWLSDYLDEPEPVDEDPSASTSRR
jgi:hypothetical protein